MDARRSDKILAAFFLRVPPSHLNIVRPAQELWLLEAVLKMRQQVLAGRGFRELLVTSVRQSPLLCVREGNVSPIWLCASYAVSVPTCLLYLRLAL